ncbi:helix-turn-helix domain-containing protein [Streptosporangium canum]|uniref:helix-turn-helix domain-containing protein n=1 Tax=Streptosporangium canum TaxID=324952 RepID=UPI0036B9E2C9
MALRSRACGSGSHLQSQPRSVSEGSGIARQRYELAAYREQIYNQIDAAGINGTATADLISDNATRHHMQAALRVLEVDGRIFRHSHHPPRWYSDRNRIVLINAMRRRVPAHDLTASEAAAVLKLPEPSIRKLFAAGDLGGRRVAGAVLIHRKAALAHIQTIGANILAAK